MYVGDRLVSVTGSSADILKRILGALPRRWFQFAAPIRDAILGGLSDGAAACYSFYTYAKQQSRIATSTGPFLDIIAYDFLGRYLIRGQMSDGTFLARIKSTILQERVTRKGMVSMLTALTGNAPWVFEPWNPNDTGAYSAARGGVQYGQFGYGVGKGGYGSLQLPGQVFIKVTPGSLTGVPAVAGYGSNIAGYGVGAVEYIGPSSEAIGLTNAQIYAAIEATKPTGVTCWTAIL